MKMKISQEAFQSILVIIVVISLMMAIYVFINPKFPIKIFFVVVSALLIFEMTLLTFFEYRKEYNANENVIYFISFPRPEKVGQYKLYKKSHGFIVFILIFTGLLTFFSGCLLFRF